jgi:type IV pilus assembly protein PilM
MLEAVEQAGLRPIAVDIEPAALLRTTLVQSRRDNERQARSMLVDIGHTSTTVVIVQNDDILFLKYLDMAGNDFDEAVARSLRMELAQASSLRRNHGDRRSDRQDPEVASSVSDAIRPVLDRLCSELSMCIRYQSVTFRGQPLGRLVLSGGEATAQLAEFFQQRLAISCETSDPFRTFPTTNFGRKGQWDVAAGLALRPRS